MQGTGETIFWLPAARALVPGDLLIGSGDRGMLVCPESWLHDVPVDRPALAELLRPLLELPIEHVLVSHGEAVLGVGREALLRAIAKAEGA